MFGCVLSPANHASAWDRCCSTAGRCFRELEDESASVLIEPEGGQIDLVPCNATEMQ